MSSDAGVHHREPRAAGNSKQKKITTEPCASQLQTQKNNNKFGETNKIQLQNRTVKCDLPRRGVCQFSKQVDRPRVGSMRQHYGSLSIFTMNNYRFINGFLDDVIYVVCSKARHKYLIQKANQKCKVFYFCIKINLDVMLSSTCACQPHESNARDLQMTIGRLSHSLSTY